MVVEEERSGDDERWHIDEQVGYVVADGGSTLDGEGEVGVLQSAHTGPEDWPTESLDGTYTDPVVVAGPLSYQDGDPAHVRLKEVGGGPGSDSFQWKIEEWDYQDGSHARERPGYLVMEDGSHTIGGTRMEAGKIDTGDGWQTVSFDQSFGGALITGRFDDGPDLQWRRSGGDPGQKRNERGV